MTTTQVPDLRETVIEAYGGRQYWTSLKSLEIVFSTGGFAWPAKLRRPFRNARFFCAVQRPFARITPIGRRPGIAGILDGKRVSLINEADGRVLQSRENIRADFFGWQGLRRKLWWNDLDLAYFANYAMWNDQTLPALLCRDDIEWSQIGEWVLEAVFPPEIPTHCARQQYYIDPQTRLVQQNDYVAEVIGGFAQAGNVIAEHKTVDGIPYPAYRRVNVRKAPGVPGAGPLVIDVRVHEWHASF